MTNTTYDVLICGGGMIGAALAIQLGQEGMSVAVFEPHQPAPFDLSQAFDLRISALNKQSQALLQACGAWQQVESMRSLPFKRMRVWELQGFGDLTFDADQINALELGYIVENRVIQTALWQVIDDMPNVTLLCPYKPMQCQRHEQGMRVVTDAGETYWGALLIGADGGNSFVRQQCGIGTNTSRYQQACLVASVDTVLGQQDITWQRFVATGPQAFLPLPGQHGSVVWYHQADEARWLSNLRNEVLAERIMAEFPAQLGHITVLDKSVFPLAKQHAQAYVQDGVALVGDAAHMINPLAGQGVNLGFQDVACLVDVIRKARKSDLPWWEASVLREYQTQRRIANRLMMETMDAFYHGFSNDNKPMKWLRNSILGAARIPPIKRMAIRHAMGLTDVSRPWYEGAKRLGW